VAGADAGVSARARLQVLIIGGGISGLALAIALRKKNIAVDLVDDALRRFVARRLMLETQQCLANPF
jgi:2-polyprenyl-6-methoxyphenol hydroxylase-like FAD-dependent oxidoreductase